MPGPDPEGIEIGPDWPERITVLAYHFPVWFGHSGGNRRHRNARAYAVLRNLKRGGWLCLWCNDPVPIYRRADACYCSQGCRKRAARARKADA